jgi:hypothetical protein
MKIAIIYDLTEAGGVQTCVFSLIKGLNNKNITPVVFWDEKPNEKLINELNLKIEFQKLHFKISTTFIKKNKNIIRYILWAFNFIKISKIPLNFDFVYCFTPLVKIDIERNHIFYLSGPPLLPQLESSNIKFKVIKGFYKMFIKPFYPAYEPQKNANYVINSEYTAQMFFEAHKRKLQVIYPSNQLDFIKEKIFNFSEKKYVTFFSRIVEYKRPEFILKLAEVFTNLEFIIMGSVSTNRLYYYNELVNEVKNRNLKNVKFIINVEKKQIIDILNKSKFYVFPAINEHFGITTVEAILYGCIPFVHNSGGQKEIVPYENLRFYDDEFLEKFKTILSHSDYELNLLINKLNLNAQKFTEESYIKRMLEYVL